MPQEVAVMLQVAAVRQPAWHLQMSAAGGSVPCQLCSNGAERGQTRVPRQASNLLTCVAGCQQMQAAGARTGGGGETPGGGGEMAGGGGDVAWHARLVSAPEDGAWSVTGFTRLC